jgi:hypothetical protein
VKSIDNLNKIHNTVEFNENAFIGIFQPACRLPFCCLKTARWRTHLVTRSLLEVVDYSRMLFLSKICL